MQSKQKVTLYLPPQLHRKLKIKAAVESEPMSALAEKALFFYLTHPEIVDELETLHGHTHQVYACPECASSVVIDQGELVSVKNQPTVLSDEEISVPSVREAGSTTHTGEEELVPCLGS